jgi:sulfate permease, SulP family
VRFDRHEISGGLGDCGLLIPIAVALIAINGIGATAAFGGAGLAYIATALYFRVPFPVQPLKAFAAAAIALQLSPQVIAAGALLMAAAMALLAASRAAGWLAARFPLVLVRGIQASVALLLAKAAVELAERGNWSGLSPIPIAASAALAIACCAVLFWARASGIPGTPIVLAVGAAVGLAVGGAPGGIEFGPQALGVSVPDGAAFGTALTTLVLAQLPLTFGNSVVATVDVEREYFGLRARRVRAGAVASSIAAMNLVAGLFGTLPMCHGAGGATAHYKLGARTAGATLAAGSLFVTLAIVFGATLPRLLEVLAPGALAGMLGFVAIQHGLLAMRLDRAADRALAAGVGAVTLWTGNLAIGFGCGVAALLVRAVAERVRERGAAPRGT